ncbi:MAG: SDR family oxidoreductase [Ruminococcaceae bacterium]|nr:SDR family oxidoreductase [Oscillospiraceae bacterium]
MKTVLITGGSRGIGRAMVELFSKNGYAVAFTYKNSENEAKSLAESTGTLAIRADSAKEEDVLRAVDTAVKSLGKIDCLINNAGISAFSLFTDISLEDWNEMLSTNLTGVFLYSKAVIPGMVSRKYGRIINVTSMWGLVGSSCEVHYSTAKAGLIGMTKALAKELGPSGITVNAIAPGVINTDMNKAISSEDMAALIDETPLMRIGEPSDVASAALFLASDEASFITGDVLNVSGGYVI